MQDCLASCSGVVTGAVLESREKWQVRGTTWRFPTEQLRFPSERVAESGFILKSLVNDASSEIVKERICRNVLADHAAVQKCRAAGLGTLLTTAHCVHTVQPRFPDHVLYKSKSLQKLTRALEDLSKPVKR